MATGRHSGTRMRVRSVASLGGLGVVVAIAVLVASPVGAAECFRSFGTREAIGSDWKVSVLQAILRADRNGRCAVVGFQFEFALDARHRGKELIVADLAGGEMFRLKLDPFGLAWESWVGFSRTDVLALDPPSGFQLGYFASGLRKDPIAVSPAIEDFLSARDSLNDFQWAVRARR